MTNKNRKSSPVRPNLGRHEPGCRICAHPQRQEIEREFVAWKSPAKIVLEYKIQNRASVYRHAHAFDLFSKRARNLRAALERIIERVDDVQVNAAAIVQAIATFARLNAQGQLVERHEQVTLHDLFERMSTEELEAYAKDGALPQWFARIAGATRDDSQEGSGDD